MLSVGSTLFACSVFAAMFVVSHSGGKESENHDTHPIQDESIKEITLYQSLFKVKRKEHLAVVQKLILERDVGKLAAYVEATLTAIIKTLSKSIIDLEISGYVIGQQFPKEQSIKEELSKVLENTAFFTDLIVRFPEPSQYFYKKNYKLWKKTMEDAIEICIGSGVFDGDYELLLNSLKQELGIGPKDESYQNPFRKSIDHSNELTTEERQQLYQEAKRKNKMKEKKTKRSGPKLNGRSKVDL